jgi:hypothetical protein
MKVRILRNIAKRRDLTEDAVVELDDAEAQALIDEKLAEHPDAKGEAQAAAAAAAVEQPLHGVAKGHGRAHKEGEQK